MTDTINNIIKERLEPELCEPLGTMLKTVLHLRPRRAADVFLSVRIWLDPDCDDRYRNMMRPSDEAIRVLASMDVAGDEVEGCTLGAAFGGERLTPKGARLLVRLIRSGVMPFSRKVDPATIDLSRLEAYGDSEPALIEASRDLRAERQAKREARDAAWAALDSRARHLAQHPDEARPEELTMDLIDRIFIHARGYGAGGGLTLGGVECFKGFDRYVSNSGKTRITTPVIWWIDADGVRRGDEEPDLRPNRRSDPGRNWGLGRE